MTNYDPATYQVGAGRDADLTHLAHGHDTGWWDDQGRPAPWPDDLFTNPEWSPTTDTQPTTNPTF